MQKRSSKTPRDPNQLAKFIVEQSTSEARATPEPVKEKNPAAVALGRIGGLKGGKARAKAMTKEQRAEIARIAATARWKKG